jgi:diaminohydroxyphosphoribosylaminopyrimidine deaminase/5-amino-6-(5-phosphoribosylamino)uracil reductase
LKARALVGGGTILATCRGAEPDRIQRYRDLGVDVWQLPADRWGRVDLSKLLKRLGKKGITSVLVEGGRRVFTALLRMGAVDKLLVFISPRLLGAGKASLGDLGIRQMDDAMPLRGVKYRRVGSDLLVTSRL